MYRRLLVVVLTLGMLIVPGMAVADPPDEPPGQETRQGRLDLYVVETDASTEAALRSAGYDIVSSAPAGERVRLEIVMSPSEAAKVRKQFDIELSLKRNKDGVTTAEAAALEAQSGFDVWRSWSESGGLRDEFLSLADQYDELTQLIPIGESVQGQTIYAPQSHRKG